MRPLLRVCDEDCIVNEISSCAILNNIYVIIVQSCNNNFCTIRVFRRALANNRTWPYIRNIMNDQPEKYYVKLRNANGEICTTSATTFHDRTRKNSLYCKNVVTNGNEYHAENLKHEGIHDILLRSNKYYPFNCPFVSLQFICIFYLFKRAYILFPRLFVRFVFLRQFIKSHSLLIYHHLYLITFTSIYWLIDWGYVSSNSEQLSFYPDKTGTPCGDF